MAPEQQRIAIAEWCGDRLFVIHKPIRDPFGYYRENAQGYTNLEHAWRVTEGVAKRYVGGKPTEADRVIMEPAPLPDYLNDLNAMHEAEKRLGDLDASYAFELAKLTNCPSWLPQTGMQVCRIARATAAQRAEALLRTIGKWID